MNRYVWEEGGKRAPQTRGAEHFDRVGGVTLAGINLGATKACWNCSRSRSGGPRNPPAPSSSFAGGGTIRLDVECIEARLGGSRRRVVGQGQAGAPD